MKKRSVSSTRFESNHEEDEFRWKKHKSTTFITDEISRMKFVRDRISSLPDELVVSILSKLSITEAARTSILSHSWEKLWIRYEGSLEFDITNKLRNVAESDRPQIKHDFLESMNRVLRTLLGSSGSPSLDSLTLRCSFLKTEVLEFDMLVEFLMAKRIRLLNFDMFPKCVSTFDYFSFPAEFFAWIKQPRGLHNISALTSLSLQYVNVSDDMIEYFVSNCPLLERLCVKLVDRLSNKLRIIGDASLKLKYLKILFVEGMKSLVVSAPNLVSLKYMGRDEIKLDVSNVPKLVKVGLSRHIMAYMSGSLSAYLAQLHTLKLFLVVSRMKDMDFSILTPPNNVVFKNLKHLIIRVSIQHHDDSFLGFTSSLVEASPMLEKFTLESMTSVDDNNKIGLHQMTTLIPTRKRCSQNQRLKVVELTRFTGVAPEVELLVYFVENFSSSLKRIIIHTSKKYEGFSEVRKERGRQLMKLIPPGVDFVLT